VALYDTNPLNIIPEAYWEMESKTSLMTGNGVNNMSPRGVQDLGMAHNI
jgi:hypothetical protein